MTEKLKPCPFCGNDKINICRYERTGESFSMYAAYCDYSEGGCGAESGRRYSIDSVKEAWNRRKDDAEAKP